MQEIGAVVRFQRFGDSQPNLPKAAFQKTKTQVIVYRKVNAWTMPVTLVRDEAAGGRVSHQTS
jgi:hypothetical protein